MPAKPIYVEARIRASLEDVWQLTRTPGGRIFRQRAHPARDHLVDDGDIDLLDDTVTGMWKEMAKALELEIPDKQLETIAPVLDSLWAQTRRALDRDLSLVDPAVMFRADLAPGGASQP